MGYYSYRLPLSDNVQIQELENIKQAITDILFEDKSLQLLRVTFNLKDKNKSIRLLSQSHDVEFIKSRVNKFLERNGITLSDIIEVDHEISSNYIMENESYSEVKKSTQHKKKIDLQTNPYNCSHEPHQGCDQSHGDHSHGDHSHGDHSHGDSHYQHHNKHWLQAVLGLAWGACLLILSMATFNIPIIVTAIITGITALMTLYLGKTVYSSAWNALSKKKLDTSVLYTISTLTIVLVSVMSLFIPGLPMLFEAAPLVLGFWHLGEAIEHSLVGKISDKLDVLDCIPPFILLKNNPSGACECSVKDLIPNDIIEVPRGSVIPVDGELIKDALLYTTRIDGSPKLKEFKAGATVKAGMRLADHLPFVEMCVTKRFNKSYLSLVAKNIKKENGEKAPIELFANKILKYFIPSLLAVAVVSGCVIGALYTPALAIQCVISVLVSACPCALSLITPLAIKIGIKKASEEGLHFKNGKMLQAASDIDIVVFDLNGTLTKGSIQVNSYSITNEKFLNHIALLESESSHPIGKIINSYIKKQQITPDPSLKLESIDKSYHCGIKGVINGESFMIGNIEMLISNGVRTINAPYDNPENGSVYIVRGKTVIGQIALIDPLRNDAYITIQHLARLGKKVHICTGSDRVSAEQYARLLGVSSENICANAVGVSTRYDEFSKSSYIKSLKAKGYKVAMVGDAINDIEAISSSDIGIAVKSDIGDDITQNHADIVVQQGLLFPIATAFDVAKKTKQNIIQNLCLSLTYNTTITLLAAGLFVFLGFTINPIVGVALMICESTLVLMNLFRFKKQETVSSDRPFNQINDNKIQQNATAKILETLNPNPQPDKKLLSTPPHVATQCGNRFFSPVGSQYSSDKDRVYSSQPSQTSVLA